MLGYSHNLFVRWAAARGGIEATAYCDKVSTAFAPPRSLLSIPHEFLRARWAVNLKTFGADPPPTDLSNTLLETSELNQS